MWSSPAADYDHGADENDSYLIQAHANPCRAGTPAAAMRPALRARSCPHSCPLHRDAGRWRSPCHDEPFAAGRRCLHVSKRRIRFDNACREYAGGRRVHRTHRAFGAPSLGIFNPVYGSPITIPAYTSHTDEPQDQLGAYLQDTASAVAATACVMSAPPTVTSTTRGRRRRIRWSTSPRTTASTPGARRSTRAI